MTDSEKTAEHFYSVIHDIRGCLHVIGMLTECLRRSREQDDEAEFEAACATIEKERQEATRLVKELLADVREILDRH